MTSIIEAGREERREKEFKPGVYERDGKLIVVGEEYIYRVCSALASPTRIKILQQLLEKEADIGEISELIGQSKANASTQVKRLEELGLVRAEYRPGARGVRKVVKAAVKEIHIILEPSTS